MTTQLCNEAEHFSRKTNLPPQHKRPRILCIDDDPEVSNALQVRLGRHGLDVIPAYFGMHGLWDATTNQPDLIILDLAMPNGDGQFVISTLRGNRMTETVPVIVLTGMTDPQLRKRVLNSGADDYLFKPVDFSVLLKAISRHVDIFQPRTDRVKRSRSNSIQSHIRGKQK